MKNKPALSAGVLSPAVLLALLMASCGISHPDVPAQSTPIDTLPPLFPDYTEVTIPSNLAPINFMIDTDEVQQCVARLDYPGGSLTYGEGAKVIIDPEEWLEVMRQSQGHDITFTLYGRNTSGEWSQYPTFTVHVAEEPMDAYVSYRLIEPSYVAYENIDIMQREVSTFEESVILSNRSEQRGGDGRCINCHSYQNYHTDNMLMHLRGKGGGTLLVHNGQSQLLTDLKQDGMISNPVYPAWHPTLPLIAFSTNHTGQFFHTYDAAKIEVIDSESELVLYDVEANRMTRLPAPADEQETFPTWTPDGRQLYYCATHYVQQDTTIGRDGDQARHYQTMRYNLYVRDFDARQLTFSDRRLVLNLDSMGQSATLPRVSPDGSKLLYASGRYGCFHIWHADADIRLLDLQTGRIDSLQALNSPLADSYPTWSSNGRWILMASRRDDGNYSRIYVAYYDREGQAHKAFTLPQADPAHDHNLLKSYNRPEPMVERVRLP